MRVLFVSQEFPPKTSWGGIGTYGGIVTPVMARRGVEVHVLSVVPALERSDSVIEGVHVHTRPLRRPRGIGRITRLPQTWGRVSLAWSLMREARALGLRFDVCESPEWFAEGLGIALRGRLPLVVRLHGGAAQTFPFTGPTGLDARFAIRCEEALVRRADIVTGPKALVEPVAGALEIPSSRVRFMLDPVARTGPISPPAEGPPKVLLAGRLEPRKGADVLIRAAPRILERHPETRFLLIGADAGGPDGRLFRQTLEELAKDVGVAHAIEMPGRLGGPEAIARELVDATLCAMPSRWESMGYVAAEAAALGRPVVASRIPGLEEIVEDGVTGRLVPVDDPGELADAINETISLSVEERREIGVAAARLIASKCDPEVIATQTIAAYEDAISLRRA